jgi:hypothetical protein
MDDPAHVKAGSGSIVVVYLWVFVFVVWVWIEWRASRADRIHPRCHRDIDRRL